MGCCASNSTVLPTGSKIRLNARNSFASASNFVTMNNGVITDNYKFGKELGAGTFGH